MRVSSSVRVRSYTVIVAASLAAGCGGESNAASSASAPKSATSAAASGATPALTASGGPSASASAKPKASSPDKALLKHLAEGRKLTKDKKYKEAVVELEKALAIHDSDAKVLSELGYAALLDKDLERSQKASEKALKTTTDPKLRASVLYNLGRVHEEKGDKAAASESYAASLALRDSDAVKKRLEGLGEQKKRVEPCTAAFPKVDDLCECLKKSDDLLSLDGARTCAPKKADLASDRLSVVEVGTNAVGMNAVDVLVAKDASGFRMVARLGERYEPGAFGVHNEAKLVGAQAKKVGDTTVVAVKFVENHADSNLAGLELCTDDVTTEVLCVLDSMTVCPLRIPVETQASCGPGVELGPDEKDPEVLEMMKAVKDGAFKRGAKTSWTVDDQGKVTVKLESGSPDALPRGLVGTHALW
jgi:tetratricopeptide (TPR) repeat protein